MNNRSLPKFTIIASIIFLSLFFVKCGEAGKDSNVKLGAEVDSSKFGKFISDGNLAIQFYSPLDWLLMKSEVSEKNESLINKRKAKERYLYKPEYIFFNEGTRSFLSVGRVHDSSENGVKDSILINYSKMLTAKYNSNDFIVEDIDNKGLLIKQYIIQKPQIISYKLIFQNRKGRLIQFEYTVPSEFFEKEKIAISSSISTISNISDMSTN